MLLLSKLEGDPTTIFVPLFRGNFKRSLTGTGTVPVLRAFTALGSNSFGFGGPIQTSRWI